MSQITDFVLQCFETESVFLEEGVFDIRLLFAEEDCSTHLHIRLLLSDFACNRHIPGNPSPQVDNYLHSSNHHYPKRYCNSQIILPHTVLDLIRERNGHA